MALYESESSERLTETIYRFEIWCWRGTKKLKWTNKVANREVLRRMGGKNTSTKILKAEARNKEIYKQKFEKEYA